MQNEKCSNKTLRICGAGGVRKNKGVWQAVGSRGRWFESSRPDQKFAGQAPSAWPFLF